MAIVAEAISTHQFKRALRQEFDLRARSAPLRSAQDINDVALELLRGRFAIDTTDVSLQVDWTPSRRKKGTLRLIPVPDFRTIQRLA